MSLERLKVAIELPWDASSHNGTGVYSETMIRALAANGDIDLLLISDVDSVKAIDLPNVSYHSPTPLNLGNESRRHIAIPALVEKLGVDCLWAPATLLPMIKVCPYIATIHDLTFIESPQYYSNGLNAYLAQWFSQTLRSADHLVAISDETAGALKRYWPCAKNITVVQQPIRESFSQKMPQGSASEIILKFGLTSPYFFHVSNLGPHKNLFFAIECFQKFRRDYGKLETSFVIAGGGAAPNQPPDFLRYARELGLETSVRYVGRVSDSQLKALYQCCTAFLFPSLAEGWGLPVAEAGALGCRVLSSAFVPAASKSQQIPLDISEWSIAMAASDATNPGKHPVAPQDAAANLIQVFRKAVSENLARYSLNSFSNPETIKVAYRGDWHSPSGFGEAARGTLQALQQVGLNVMPEIVNKDSIQVIHLGPKNVSSRIHDADVWIHHIPPEYYDLERRGKHVGQFVWETERLPNQNAGAWRQRLNQLDEVWVPSSFLKATLTNSGVYTPTYVVRHAIDADRYSPGPRRKPACPFPTNFDPTWTVILFVGTWDPRKQPDVLVQAFCKAFCDQDRALLLIKSYVTGQQEKDSAILENWLAHCRSGTAHIGLMSGIISEEEMINIYRFASAFATASHGEGFCLPAVQAMSCGKPVIAAGWSAFQDFPVIDVRFDLSYVPESVRLPGYDCSQQWAQVDAVDLSTKLRWVHENRAEAAKLGVQSREWVKQNSSIHSVRRTLLERITKLAGVK
jgi:glycosyltransferase involved in cell wall biosynthesis